mmetsp:Transcript_20974/g.20089  ORF Transcript_20974/g.20089 Transcript_20974/m.20089 type:complete len:104 (+) Transcript_20974:177-488(+)
MSYFESLIKKYDEELDEPLIAKRQYFNQDDPIEELQEVYSEVKIIETNFRKALEVCGFMIEKNKELYQFGEKMEKDYNSLKDIAETYEDRLLSYEENYERAKG